MTPQFLCKQTHDELIHVAEEEINDEVEEQPGFEETNPSSTRIPMESKSPL
jgi:hypothetical protein